MLTFKNTKQELVSGFQSRMLTFKNTKLEPRLGDKTSASKTSRKWERKCILCFYSGLVLEMSVFLLTV
jgi:hypothetical protein